MPVTLMEDKDPGAVPGRDMLVARIMDAAAGGQSSLFAHIAEISLNISGKR